MLAVTLTLLFMASRLPIAMAELADSMSCTARPSPTWAMMRVGMMPTAWMRPASIMVYG